MRASFSTGIQNERDYINKLLDEHSYLVSNIATNMREKMFEKAYAEEMNGQKQAIMAQPAGKKCFKENASKWGHVRLTEVPTLFAASVGDPAVASWFKGPQKLPAEVARRALFKNIGVTDDTPIPDDHHLGEHIEPLKHLVRLRAMALGSRYDKVVKETVVQASNWWALQEVVRENEAQPKIKLQLLEKWGSPKDVPLKAINLEVANDWNLDGADSLDGCTLNSDEAEVDEYVLAQSIRKILPVFDQEFGYADFPEVPGFPREPPATTPAGLASSSASASASTVGLQVGLPLPVAWQASS